MTRCSAAIAAAASAVVLFACGGDSGGNPSREVELAPKGAASPKFADEPSGAAGSGSSSASAPGRARFAAALRWP